MDIVSEFKASLIYKVSSRLVRATNRTLFKKKKKKNPLCKESSTLNDRHTQRATMSMLYISKLINQYAWTQLSQQEK